MNACTTVHSRCSRLKNVTSSFSEPGYEELDIKARKSHSLITVLDEERESGVMLQGHVLQCQYEGNTLVETAC